MVVDDDGEMYRRYADELIRFATALVGPSFAEDVLATAVLNALATARWRSVENKRAYLYRSVVNEAAKVHRGTQRRTRRELQVAGAGSFEPDYVDPDVIAGLSDLSTRQRAVIYLTYWADLRPADVAAVIGSSRRTVERELATARRRLERTLS